LELLPKADEHIQKLEDIVSKSTLKLEDARAKWEEKKKQYLLEIEKENQARENKKNKANDILEEIKNLRQQMRNIANEIREKEEMLEKLTTRLNKLPKTADRQIYVERILGVVKNLETQTQQIRNILQDVSELQRETNKITETSKRTFGMTDDLVFRAAQTSKETQSKTQLNKMYRYMVTMRENFDTIIETVRNISNTQNEIRDLEYQIAQLKEKVESLEMDKIKNDCKEVEDENEQLAKKIKEIIDKYVINLYFVLIK